MSERFRRRPALVAGRFAVSAALLWLVLRHVDGDAVLARLSSLDPRWAAAGLAVTVLQVATLAWRWRFTLARLGIELPLGAALAEYYLGILLNQVLPGGVLGDVSRAWRHARTDAPTGAAVRAVFLERASAQVVMTVVAIVSLLWLPWASVGVRVAAGAGVAVACSLGLRGLDGRSHPDSVVGRLRADARQALLAPDALPAQLGSALLVVASYVVVFVVAARAVGADTPLATLLPLVAPVLMTMLIPVSVAGWGVREAAAAVLWGLTGLSPEEGAVISLTYGLLVLVSSAPGLLALTSALFGGRGRRARPPRE